MKTKLLISLLSVLILSINMALAVFAYDNERVELLQEELISILDGTSSTVVFDPATGEISFYDVYGINTGTRYNQSEYEFWSLIRRNREATVQLSSMHRMEERGINRNVTITDRLTGIITLYDNYGNYTLVQSDPVIAPRFVHSSLARVPFAIIPQPWNSTLFLNRFVQTERAHHHVMFLTHNYPNGLLGVDIRFTNEWGDCSNTIWYVGANRSIAHFLLFPGERYGVFVSSPDGTFERVFFTFHGVVSW